MSYRDTASGTRYEIIAPIGRGGMAEVDLALMAVGGGVHRLAVLKRIWPEMAADPEFMAMFLDEARLSLCLSHPNIVQTYEVVTERAGPAIAMEYLDGQPLTRVLSRLRGPHDLSLPLKVRVLTHVLSGLEYAHTLTDFASAPMGVVHRDVSPQNVFVTYDGQVKLVDFGVAKSLAASHHTRPGAIKGKLAYMAPEQLRPGAIDRRADLFSVGVMLWEILAGRRLWHGMTEVDIVSHLAAWRALPPLSADGSIPAGLDAICARALALDPDSRYQSAADFELDLETALAGSADSHVRSLGRVVSLAFAAERAERQTLIERHLGRGQAPGGEPTRALSTTRASVPQRAALTLPAADWHSADTLRVPVRPRSLWLRRGVALAALAALAVVTVRNGSLRHTRGAAAQSEPPPPSPAPAPAPQPAPEAPAAAPATLAVDEAPPITEIELTRPKRHKRHAPRAPSESEDAKEPPFAAEPPGQDFALDLALPKSPSRPIRAIIVENPFTR